MRRSMWNRLAPDANMVLWRARQLAKQMGGGPAGTTHLAVEIVRNFGGAGGFWLRDAVPCWEDVRGALRARVDSQPIQRDESRYSLDLVALVEDAVLTAERYRVTRVGSEFFLLVLLRNPQSVLCECLSGLQLNSRDVLRFVARELGATPGGLSTALGFAIKRVSLWHLPEDVRDAPFARTLVGLEMRMTDHQLARTDAYKAALSSDPGTADELRERVVAHYTQELRCIRELEDEGWFEEE